MEFNKIIAVSGRPGLFQIISQSKSAIIAESLIDNKRCAISSAQNISLLENIAIYTYEEDAPLWTIFKTMFEKSEGKEVISHKENEKKIITYFAEILPNYDNERVYTSNIKKVIQWFNILVSIGFDFSKTEKPIKENTEKS